MAVFTLPKEERLSGTVGISHLMSKGRWGSVGEMKFCCIKGSGKELNRIVVSVPKRLFKRAVKRNLLKRRIRDCYRRNKLLLEGCGIDILFSYNTSEVLPLSSVENLVKSVLSQINSWE